ncbi:DUF6438 domain-containing protein [Kaistella jeonii]|uniref:DUF6438 domain-containing protein n=1 Tax=Kaistella jeonii TaxID=266749 RepID=A0A0C1FMC7_9FLAO|nr:DUF6438 domain-containing protein [Kaistella jeonii]KIA89089.1 hypothetical protein OA86_08475 [Kaistella jeonii]
MFIILVSCKSEKQKQFEKDIVGEWNYDKQVEYKKHVDDSQIIEEPPSPFFANLGGFIFKDNGTVIDKIGFFDFNEGKSREERKITYKGDSTDYKLDNDSLKILDPIKNSWSNYKIISITKDTLKLQKHDGYYLKYFKPKYELNADETFDKIIISSSGCYGTCAINSIEFDRSGKVFYYGEKYNTINGFYKSTISNIEYNKIENSFKKANINKLKNNYYARVTDLNTITITFVKNNKIIKTISDYGSQAPSELVMAYRKALYKYQNLKLSQFKTEKDFPLSTMFRIDKRKKTLFLADSERFLLLNEILNAKQVELNFKENFNLTIFGDEDKDIVIKTNGRFFKYGTKIYDIGYNFIEKNNLEIREENY